MRRLALWFVLALLAVGVGQAMLYMVHRDTARRVQASRDVLRVASSALAFAHDGARGRLMELADPGAGAVVAVATAASALRAALDTLDALTTNDAPLHARALALAESARRWQSAVESGPAPAHGAAQRAHAEARAFDALRAAVDEFLAFEEAQRAAQRRRDDVIIALALAAALLPLAVLAALLWRVARVVDEQHVRLLEQQEHLEQQAVELEEQAAELEVQMEELAQANTALVQSHAAEAGARAEREREAAERAGQVAILDAALQSVPIALAIIDRDLRYIKVNEATAVMTGVPVEAHAGRTLREVNPLLDDGLETAFREVLATGEPCLNLRISRPTPHAKGGVLEILVHMSAFRGPDGGIAGVCSTATDVTAWNALKEQFHQAQKLESAGRLSASIAHDFNNLLTVISTYCDLLLLEIPAGSRNREEVEAIRGAATRASTLARRMLGASHSKAMIATPVDLSAVVLETRDLLEHAMRDGVRLEMSCDDGPSVVVVDPTQVEQVLMNLVINAVDATPGVGRVTVGTRVLTLDAPQLTACGEIPAGAYAELTVADTGTGMDEQTKGRIFEPFFTTKPRDKGTGLGLATVFGIVHDLRGGIEVTSEPGRGTTFRVLLPRVAAEEGSGPRRARAVVTAALPRGNETLLLVEDGDALRKMLMHLFSRQGYRVLEARHGGEAMRLLTEESTIDLVVSDLHMPGVGGRELAARMRALGKEPPVLFMSGTAGMDDDAGDASHPPLDSTHRFIGKPFEMEEMLTTVRAMLDGV